MEQGFDNFITARVHLLDVPYHIDKQYEYFIPLHLRGNITAGGFVIVPFGGGNTKQPAVVMEVVQKGELTPDKMKPILSLFNTPDNITLNDEMIKLCVFMKEHTFCTIGDAVKTILPSSVFVKYNEIYSVAEPLPNNAGKSVPSDALIVYNYIEDLGNVSISRLKTDHGSKVDKTINKLLEAGLIRCDLEFSNTGHKSETFATLTDTELTNLRFGIKQEEVIYYLRENGTTNVSVLKDFLSVSQSTIKSLADKKVIKLDKIDAYRDPYRDIGIEPDENILSDEQSEAADKIISLCHTGEPKAVLLHGVTGSGKTRVIKSITDEILQLGKQIIILVPEISLTPQTVALFKSYYKDRVIVMHSLLSAGERFDAWRLMKNGTVDICVGTRSAIFAPFNNLGLIVIDEEQEHTYKSDMSPKYHARDIARFRCGEHKAVMLLSSATPSVESYHKAEQGTYTLVELTGRYGNAVIPQSIMADLRIDSQNGMLSPIGSVLREEIEKNLQNNEQTILFLNRRGYNNFINCPLCGNVVMCPRCSVSLTYHNSNDMYGLGKHLQCHYCGYVESIPETCPNCGGKHIAYMGYGTQKVEEELQALYPTAKVMRMDADTTSFKFSYDEMLDRFRSQGADILLGTQMVTKGHDFPNVTLVGVISADMSLYLSDYRANERTFSLMTQVIGRSGRSDKEGRAVIQTYNPAHPVLLMSAEQDYKEFYENEIAYRKALIFQPFCDMVVVMFSSETETEVINTTAAFAGRLRELKQTVYRDIGLIIYGPFEAPVYKVNDKYRMHVVVKCRMNSRTRYMFRELMKEFNSSLYKKITISIDVNPTII